MSTNKLRAAQAQAATEKAYSGADIADWRPEDERFWATTGKAIATRNLWISIPNLLIGFAVDLLMVAVKIAAPGLGGGEHVLAHPRGDRRTADIAIDDTDRYVGSQVPP